MGLDMYMFKCKAPAYIDVCSEKRKVVKLCQEALDNMAYERAQSECISFVDYWRYANQIYRWFLENTEVEYEDSGPYRIKWEELLLLKATCRQVLESGVDKNGEPVAAVCEKLLPTLDGPCFGDTHYDANYFEEIRLTHDLLVELLETSDWDEEVILLYADW